jgi:signal peptidase I
VAAAVACGVVRLRPSRVAIEGGSMAPTLLQGDWALTVIPLRYGRGDVVVLEHPGRPGYEIVKRIVGAPGDRVGGRRLGPDEWWVEGDHARSSTDSRQFGPVARGAVRARVVAVYAPAGRRARVR